MDENFVTIGLLLNNVLGAAYRGDKLEEFPFLEGNMMQRSFARFAVIILVAVAVSAPRAQERTPVATLTFGVGEADLTDEHRAVLDGLRQKYSPDDYIYLFEGDHDATGYIQLTPKASQRLSERLAETRWQNAAHHLGVPPFGLVHATGRTDVRIYVEPRSRALEDSLATLRREMDRLRDELGTGQRPDETPPPTRKTAPPDTVLAVAQLEEIYERSDKWVDDTWWEAQGGAELGILRVSPQRPGEYSGAMLRIASGTPAHMPFEITLRLDVIRLGVERFGVTPALRWYDWDIRVHYGDDREADISFVNRSDPAYMLGLDLDARPWSGAWMGLEYAGVGTRVHAAHREVISYDHYDFRFEQRIVPRVRFEAQAVYDERFKKSLAYAGGWFAYVWPMRLGEFAVSLGFVEQLDANLATTPIARLRAEDLISTISLGFKWRRTPRYR